MYTIRINHNFRKYFWTQAEVGTFDPEEELTERSGRNLQERQHRASRHVPVSRQARQVPPLSMAVPGPAGFPHLEWLDFAPEAYRRLEQLLNARPPGEH